MANRNEIVTNLVNTNTGENIFASIVTTNTQGVVLTDANKAQYCGGLYTARKVNGKTQFLKWNTSGAYPISRLKVVNQNNLQKLINDFGTESANILLDKTIEITQNLTIPKNVKIQFLEGSVFNINNNVELTVLSSVENINQQLVSGLGNVSFNSIYLTPEMFGADNSGNTDTTIQLQKMFSSVKEGHTILFKSNSTYQFTLVELKIPNVNINCNSSTLTGTIKIGDTIGKTYNCHIINGRFTSATSAIQCLNTRRVFIHDNIFRGCDKTIEVLKTTLNQQHVNAQIEVTKNTFSEVNYGFFVDRTSANTWQTTSDCKFSNNIANSALITTVYCDAIDGLEFSNNTLFFPSDAVRRVNKKHHLRIDTASDWIVVQGNQCFESGEESIYLTGCKALNCTGNNFAWTGQKGVYSIIKLDGSVTDHNIVLTNNVFDGFSGNVISTSVNTYGVLSCTGNVVSYSNTFSNYFGTTDLSTIDHYILDLGTGFSRYSENGNTINSISNLKRLKIGAFIGNAERKENFITNSFMQRQVNINANTPTPVVKLRNSSLNATTVYSGELLIQAKNDVTSSANTAVYKLLVSRFNNTIETVEVFRAGLTTGAATGHPSFIFSIDLNGDLVATPVGLTALNCYFIIEATGDISLNLA